MDNVISLGYKGFLNIKLNYKGKLLDITKHNTGTTYLKLSFARVLSGNYDKNLDLPYSISFECEDTINNQLQWVSCIKSGDLPITGKKYSVLGNDTDNQNWAAIFTSVLSWYDLDPWIFSGEAQSIQEDDPRKFRFCIKNKSGDIFATININPVYLCKIVPGSQAIITWNMQLVNTT